MQTKAIRKFSKEHRRKLSEAQRRNPVRYWLGKKRSPEDIEKFRKSHLGKPHTIEHRLKLSERLRGERSVHWRGGVTSKNEIIRKSVQYKIWRDSVFKRDNYTCVICGSKGRYLNADHIKQFAYFPELRFDVSNGRTLCVLCHRETDTWGRKEKTCVISS